MTTLIHPRLTLKRFEILESLRLERHDPCERRKTATGSGRTTRAPRLDLVQRVRSEIAAGTYDDDRKMDLALDRLLRLALP